MNGILGELVDWLLSCVVNSNWELDIEMEVGSHCEGCISHWWAVCQCFSVHLIGWEADCGQCCPFTLVYWRGEGRAQSDCQMS